jgi:FlaA1/EpsC-like NDP-sugar epimerase
MQVDDKIGSKYEIIKWKTVNTTLSEQLQNLIENSKYHTVETVPKSRKTKITTVRTVPKSILELFWQCGIYCFSIRFWSYSDSVVFFVFLLDFGVILTVWYLLFSIRFWSCSDSVVFTVFLLDFGVVLTAWYLIENSKYHTVRTTPKSNRKTVNTTLSEQLQNLIENSKYHFSIRFWSCSDSVVFTVFY